MTVEARRRWLRNVLLATAAFLILLLPLMFEVWPAGFRWTHHASSPYERMIIAIYFSLGLCLVPTAFNPERHVMLIDFTIVSSLLHGAVMTFDAFAQPHEMKHLIGDVPALFILAGVLIWLHPRRWPTNAPLERSANSASA